MVLGPLGDYARPRSGEHRGALAMRVAVLSDIHGNLPALDAVLAACREQRVDRYVSAGDSVGYGPHPGQCIDRLREIDAIAVAGNHEMYVLGQLEPDRFSARAERSLAWTQQVLGSERTEYLSGLPPRAAIGPVVVAHASLDSVDEYVIRPSQASRQLGLLANLAPEAGVLVLGHTHQPLFHTEGRRSRTMSRTGARALSGRRHLVNPGSIGQSRQWERVPRARYALLDLDERRVHWYALEYSPSTVLRDLAAAGLPADSIHVRPTARRALSRAIRAHTDLSVPRVLRGGRRAA
jgi:predicted phosphodiesterase